MNTKEIKSDYLLFYKNKHHYMIYNETAYSKRLLFSSRLFIDDLLTNHSCNMLRHENEQKKLQLN